MLVKNNTQGLISINALNLIPGLNTVNMAEWLKARTHKSIQKRIELDMIEEQTDVEAYLAEHGDNVGDDENEGSGFTEDDMNHLKGLSIPHAKTAVSECFSRDLLEAWKGREDRNQVKGAINKQIELLGEPLPDRDRSKYGSMNTGGDAQEVNLGHNIKANAEDV